MWNHQRMIYSKNNHYGSHFKALGIAIQSTNTNSSSANLERSMNLYVHVNDGLSNYHIPYTYLKFVNVIVILANIFSRNQSNMVLALREKYYVWQRKLYRLQGKPFLYL